MKLCALFSPIHVRFCDKSVVLLLYHLSSRRGWAPALDGVRKRAFYIFSFQWKKGLKTKPEWLGLLCGLNEHARELYNYYAFLKTDV